MRTLITAGLVAALVLSGIVAHEIFACELPPKVVALTFDDGPHPIYTPKILDILREYNVKATFFLFGKRVERFPQIVRQIASEGHEVGNHTYSHPNDLPKESWNKVMLRSHRTSYGSSPKVLPTAERVPKQSAYPCAS